MAGEDIKTAAAETAGEDAPDSASLTETATTEAPKVEGETSTAPAEESTATKIDEAVKATSDEPTEADSILEDDLEPHKDGVQKRIDKLTAEKKALQERLEKLEADASKSDPKDPVYSEEQLKKALNKAISEGDADLVWEIQQYQLKQVKKELRDEYAGEQRKRRETVERATKEWSRVVETYDYLSATSESEIYKGSHKELNIKDQTSLLYQVALKLFTSQDTSLRELYGQPGGQQLAVADALQLILKKKRGQLGSKGDTDILKRQLAKEKRKSSLGTGEALKDDTPLPKKFSSDKERLDDYVAERIKFRNDRIGI